MTSIKKEQVIKINEKCFNGFKLDIEMVLIHNEKMLYRDITINENLKIEFKLRYKKTEAGQKPFLSLRKWSRRDVESLWTSTDWGKEEETTAPAAARKNISVLQKLTDNYDIETLNTLISKYYPELIQEPEEEPAPEPTQVNLFDIVIEEKTPEGTAQQEQEKEIVNNSYKENNNIIIELNKNNDLILSLLNDILKYNYYKIEDVEKCYIEHLPADRGEYQIVNIIFKDNNKTTMAINKKDYIKFIEEVEQQHQEPEPPEPTKATEPEPTTKTIEEATTAAQELINNIPISEGSNANKYLKYCKDNNISTTKRSIQRHAVKCHLFKHGISYHWHKVAEQKGATTKEELYNIYFSELVSMIQQQESSAAS